MENFRERDVMSYMCLSLISSLYFFLPFPTGDHNNGSNLIARLNSSTIPQPMTCSSGSLFVQYSSPVPVPSGSPLPFNAIFHNGTILSVLTVSFFVCFVVIVIIFFFFFFLFYIFFILGACTPVPIHLRYPEGAFTDGSFSRNYKVDSDCGWYMFSPSPSLALYSPAFIICSSLPACYSPLPPFSFSLPLSSLICFSLLLSPLTHAS